MEIPIIINWTSPFPFKCFVFYFNVYQKSYRTFWKQTVETLIRGVFYGIWSESALFVFVPQKDAKLKWAN